MNRDNIWIRIAVVILAIVIGWKLGSDSEKNRIESKRPQGKVGFGQAEPELLA